MNFDSCVYLIPYFNSYDDLIPTLASLEESVDVVIVDDGSEEKLADIIDKEVYDFDMEIVTLRKNLGIENALNEGLSFIYNKYEYVFRLDCGDKSYPNRVRKQFSYLVEHSDCVLVGSWARYVDEKYNTILISELPVEDHEIRKSMYSNNMFVHPSVAIRLDILERINGYPTNRKAAEDYALFFSLLNKGSVHNIDEVLLDYVVSENSISSRKRRVQVLSRLFVLIDHFEFSKECIYGVVRAFTSYVLPRSFMLRLRKILKVN